MLVMLEETHCPDCHVVFGLPKGFLDDRRRDGRSYWCPNGHNLSYKETEADRLRRQRDRLQQENARLIEAAEAERRAAIAARGQVTRLRKRAQNGVCPCCNRTFANLARHMAGKHPDFAQEAA